MAAVWRPLVVEERPKNVIRNLDLDAVGNRHHEKLAVLVRKRDPGAIRRPQGAAELGRVALADLPGLRFAGLVDDPDLVLTARIAVVCPRAAGEVAGRALFNRHREDLAAGDEDCALTLRRDVEA